MALFDSAAPRVLLAIAAALLASVPLVRVRSVVRRFDAALRTALGPDVLAGVPAEAPVRQSFIEGQLERLFADLRMLRP